MDENVRQTLSYVLHERMKAKAALENLRLLEETNLKKSYAREIDKCLDRMIELDKIYDKINKQLKNKQSWN